MVLRSNGLTPTRDLSSIRLLRELETKKSIIIIACELAAPLYWPPSVKLRGTQGYTYCSKASVGSFSAGWMARKNVEPIYTLIFDELSKRCDSPPIKNFILSDVTMVSDIINRPRITRCLLLQNPLVV